MERNVFSGLLKDLIGRLYDLSVIETHPLTALVIPPAGFRGSRGEYLQQLIQQAIEKLPPPGKPVSPSAPEWRPYLILHKRYIEGLPPQQVASSLALSERQMRRDHSRALQALAGRLWEQLFEDKAKLSGTEAEESEPAPTFEFHPEVLDLNEITSGAVQTLQPRAQAEGIELFLSPAPSNCPVLADRVVLRQILFSLLNYAFHIQSEHAIQLKVQQHADAMSVEIQFQVDEHWGSWDADEHEDSLESAHYWAGQIGALIHVSHPENERAGSVQLRLELRRAGEATVMIIEDQQPTLRMYQRYLSRTNFKVVGVADPQQALLMAKQIQPALVLLDVMMPAVDGWEILQSLQMDAQTSQIPVIVCSAWDAPEMARSLGAVEFLKKPLTQQSLLEVLDRLGLTASDKLVGPPLEEPEAP